MPELTTIAFDADDTLWHHERFFKLTQQKFTELLRDYADPHHLAEHLLAAERRNVKHYGFGVKGFTLSMVETAIQLTNGRIPGTVIEEILAAGREMLRHPVETLPFARETLERLSGTYRIILITKGGLFDQERKLRYEGRIDNAQRESLVKVKDARNALDALLADKPVAVAHTPARVAQDRRQVRVVAAEPDPRPGRQDQVAVGGDADGQLGQASGLTPLAFLAGPAPAPGLEVPADVARLEVAAVDGQRLEAQPQRPRRRRQAGHHVQQFVDVPLLQQDLGRPAERVVVRGLAHADVAAPVFGVLQQRLGLAVALALVFLDHQAGEELGQREVVAGELAGVTR